MSATNPLLTNLPSTNSGSQTWIQFYTDLNDNLGEKKANSDFLSIWAKRGTESANSSDLRALLKTHNVTIDENTWDSIVDTTQGAASYIGSIGSGIKTMGYAAVGIIMFSVVVLVIGVATHVEGITKGAVEGAKFA